MRARGGCLLAIGMGVVFWGLVAWALWSWLR